MGNANYSVLFPLVTNQHCRSVYKFVRLQWDVTIKHCWSYSRRRSKPIYPSPSAIKKHDQSVYHSEPIEWPQSSWNHHRLLWTRLFDNTFVKPEQMRAWRKSKLLSAVCVKKVLTTMTLPPFASHLEPNGHRHKITLLVCTTPEGSGPQLCKSAMDLAREACLHRTFTTASGYFQEGHCHVYHFFLELCRGEAEAWPETRLNMCRSACGINEPSITITQPTEKRPKLHDEAKTHHKIIKQPSAN